MFSRHRVFKTSSVQSHRHPMTTTTSRVRSSMLPFLPLILRGGSFFWPPGALKALKALAKGPESSLVDSGEVLYDSIMDLRHEVGLKEERLKKFSQKGYALFFDDVNSQSSSGTCCYIHCLYVLQGCILIVYMFFQRNICIVCVYLISVVVIRFVAWENSVILQLLLYIYCVYDLWGCKQIVYVLIWGLVAMVQLISRADSRRWFWETLPWMARLLLRFPDVLDNHYKEVKNSVINLKNGERNSSSDSTCSSNTANDNSEERTELWSLYTSLSILQPQHPGIVLLSQVSTNNLFGDFVFDCQIANLLICFNFHSTMVSFFTYCARRNLSVFNVFTHTFLSIVSHLLWGSEFIVC